MTQFIQLVGTLLALAILIAIFVLEMVGHLDVIEKKFPSLWVIMHSRPIIFALLISIIVFLQRDFKDALPSYPPPIVKLTAPAPPVIQITTIEPPPIVNVLPVEPKQKAYMDFGEPTVKYEIGSQISVNIRCTTNSEVPAQKVSCNGQFFVLALTNGDLRAEDEDNQYKQFEANMKPAPEDQRPTISKGNVAFGTSFGPILTEELKTRLDGGGYTFLVAGALFFKDDLGTHRINTCSWIQPPLGNPPRVWHICRGHNGIVN
jgi:hypothetical protein